MQSKNKRGGVSKLRKLWHYTTVVKLEKILREGCIQTTESFFRGAIRPGVFFSKNGDWDPKGSFDFMMDNISGEVSCVTIDQVTRYAGGLARIGVACRHTSGSKQTTSCISRVEPQTTRKIVFDLDGFRVRPDSSAGAGGGSLTQSKDTLLASGLVQPISNNMRFQEFYVANAPIPMQYWYAVQINTGDGWIDLPQDDWTTGDEEITKPRIASYKIPLIPDEDIALYCDDENQGSRFIRLFNEAWRIVPEPDKKSILQHWHDDVTGHECG